MKDSTLIRIALGISFLGLIALALINPDPVSLNTNQLNREVKLTGRVARVGEYEKTIFLKLEHVVTTDITVFKARDLDVRVGDEVVVTGVMEEGKMIAYRIKTSQDLP